MRRIVGRLDVLAGEGEEDLVERRPPQGDVVDLDAGQVEGASGVEQSRRCRRRRAWPRCGSRGRARTTSTPNGARTVGDRGEVVGPPGVDLDHVATGLGLELARRAVGDDSALVDDHDPSASWSASSRYWVVSSTSVPCRDEGADGVPQLDAAAGVEAGGGLVEQQQAGRPDQAGAEVEPAAHAARVGAHEAIGGVGQAELVEHGRAALARAVRRS